MQTVQRLRCLAGRQASLIRSELTNEGDRLMAEFGIHAVVEPRRQAAPGFRVLSVQEDSPADHLGLRSRDLILHLNGVYATRVWDLPAAFGRGAGKMTILLVRNGMSVRLSDE
jgi:S1-C subfamily serine protease